MRNFKQEIEGLYWPSFLLWLEDGVSFDPRNGESIETLFWYWYVKVLDQKMKPIVDINEYGHFMGTEMRPLAKTIKE